jgi:hypothetical protein
VDVIIMDLLLSEISAFPASTRESKMMKSARMFVSKRLSGSTTVGENYKRVNTTAIILATKRS